MCVVLTNFFHGMFTGPCRDDNVGVNLTSDTPCPHIIFCTSSIAACRAVIRLMEFSATEAYVHDMTHVSGNKGAKQSVIPRLRSRREKSMSTRPEVHVTTEHFTMAEFP